MVNNNFSFAVMAMWLLLSGCVEHQSEGVKHTIRELEDCSIAMQTGGCGKTETEILLSKVKSAILSDRDNAPLLAREFAEMVLDGEITLEDYDYQKFERRVSFYKSAFDCGFEIMVEANVDRRYLLDYLFGGLNKYREVCLSVLDEAWQTDMNDSMARGRNVAAWNVACGYDQMMRSLDKKIKYRYLNVLPDTLHDECWERYGEFVEERHIALTNFYRLSTGEAHISPPQSN